MFIILIIKNFVQTCVSMLSIITITSFLGGYWWIADLLSHGRVQYLLCAILGFVTLFTIMLIHKGKGSKKHLVVSLMLVVLNAYPVISFYYDASNLSYSDNGKPFMRVMSMNVLTSNNQHEKVIDEIRHENPDILLLMEVNSKWLDKLSVIETIYPYKIAKSRPDNFGIALYSKTEFISKNIEEWGERRLSYITASIKDSSDNIIDIIGVHTLPPMTKEIAKDNHNQLQYLIDNTMKKQNDVIMLGDFNKTPWSHSYSLLMQDSNLYNVANGAFPSGSWLKPFMGGILIDHILAKGLSAQNWHIGQGVGSDHRPVIVDISER